MHKHYIWRLKLLVPVFRKGICLPDTQTSEIHSYYSVQCFILLAVEAKKDATDIFGTALSLEIFIGFTLCHDTII